MRAILAMILREESRKMAGMFLHMCYDITAVRCDSKVRERVVAV